MLRHRTPHTLEMSSTFIPSLIHHNLASNACKCKRFSGSSSLLHFSISAAHPSDRDSKADQLELRTHEFQSLRKVLSELLTKTKGYFYWHHFPLFSVFFFFFFGHCLGAVKDEEPKWVEVQKEDHSSQRKPNGNDRLEREIKSP